MVLTKCTPQLVKLCLYLILCLIFVTAQSCTPEQAQFVTKYIAAIRPGVTNIPSMDGFMCSFNQPSHQANPEFSCEVPFGTNIAYFIAYEKPVCSLTCEILPDELASTNSTLAQYATRPEMFVFDATNTCDVAKFNKSPYFVGNAHFKVTLNHPSGVTITALPKSLQEKLALKKRDGTPVYTQDTSIKDQITLTSTMYVGMIVPQGYMEQDGVVRRFFTVERTETYILGIEEASHPEQYKVYDTNSETDDKKNLLASMIIQSPDNYYLNDCTVKKSDFGELHLNVKPTPKQPLYETSLNTVEPSATGYYGQASMTCIETICDGKECKPSAAGAEFSIKINQRVPSSFNFTTAVTAGQFNLYQGSTSADFSVPVSSYTNAYSRASIGFNPEREFDDYKVSVLKASLCAATEPCNTIVENDEVVANTFTSLVAMKFFTTEQMQAKGFKVNSFGFSFDYEPYRKFTTKWRFVVSFLMKPVAQQDQKVQVKRAVYEVTADNDSDPAEKGFFNFMLRSIEAAAPPTPGPATNNWLMIALGITVGVLGLALVAAVVVIGALLIRSAINRSSKYQTV